ncbi:MAG TPA: helix-turn-helix transcriptional regulator [Ktedonobacteraceae bacterium]|nr:helix-turn-helix transcriptional regulator [Ktedonobacteraceae bacterium]
MPDIQTLKRRLRVKEVLAQRHMSMAKLSRRGGLTLRTVRNVCRNPFHAAREITLQKIAKTLDVPVSDLFEDVPGDGI